MHRTRLIAALNQLFLAENDSVLLVGSLPRR
jgi:hypothetical protein